jgi:DNA modification methylase
MKEYQIIQGDVRDVLATLPDESVHCVVTSPPYWGLRSYGTEPQVWGGDAACEHDWSAVRTARPNGSGGKPTETNVYAQKRSTKGSDNYSAFADYEDRATYSDTCANCGAWRGHLGLEPTPQEFVAHMVEVFREVRRVLRRDGTLWLNLGDSYANNPSTTKIPRAEQGNGSGVFQVPGQIHTDVRRQRPNRLTAMKHSGLKHKDLVGMPWEVAFALRDDGWYLRSAITWCKRAPMPESVTDRPTSATEMIFLLAKSERYYYDADAVREITGREADPEWYEARKARVKGWTGPDGTGNMARQNAEVRRGDNNNFNHPLGRNLWNYWILGPEPYAAAHFATFPTAIPDRCIRAGTSERGVCPECGAPWRRDKEPTPAYAERLAHANDRGDWYPRIDTNAKREDGTKHGKLEGGIKAEYITTGWQPTCKCGRTDTVPATVLDPFSGAGTTALVALRLGRRAIGIELNAEYIAMSHKRIQGDPQAMNLNMQLEEIA